MMTHPRFRYAIRGGARECCAALLLTLVWIFSMARSPAATISWSGAGGDELWSNPANWTGGALPTPDDDVIINVPGNATVRMDAYNVWVRSLQCAETFVIEYGPFRVTAGASTISGTLAFVPSYYGLEASSAGTVLTLSGAVTNVVSLSALNGAVIAVPGVRQLAVVPWPYSSSLSASGAGSALVMTNLTNVVISPYTYLRVSAAGGGLVDLRRLQNPDGPLQVSAAEPDSMVNLSAMSGLWKLGEEHAPNWWRHALSATDRGTILIPNITAFENVDVTVAGMTNIPLAQVQSFTLGTLSLTGRTNGLNALTNFTGSLSATDTRLHGLVALANFNGSVSASSGSRLDLTNATSLHATNMHVSIEAYQGSIINLSRVTNVTGGIWPYQFAVSASGASRVDLRALRLPTAPIIATSVGDGSVIDLAGLVGDLDGCSFTAKEGGSLLASNVTSLRNAYLDIRDSATLPTVQLRSGSNVSITLYGRTNGLDGLTNFSGYLSVDAGTRLDLTNFSVLHATSYQPLYFYASGGSHIDLSRLTNVVSDAGYGLSAQAVGGSTIDLSGLLVPAGYFSAVASGPDSLLDLSRVSGVWRGGYISAGDGGTLFMPNVTALDGVGLNVSDSANVNLTQLTSITASSVTLTGRTNDFAGLTNFSGTLAAYATWLDLTNLTALYATNSHAGFEAYQGSVIDLSKVTNAVSNWPYSIYATVGTGGRIDLSRLAVPNEAYYFQVNGSGPGSFVDLSGFEGFWDGYGSVSASDGATLAISNVTAMRGISLNLSDDAIVPTAQLRSYSEGLMHLYSRTNTFSEMTNFSGNLNCYYASRAVFPKVMQLDLADYSIALGAFDDGTVISFPQVTTVVANSGNGLSLNASGGGRVELPLLETILAPNFSIGADGAGSVVDLSSLSGLFSDSNAGRLITRNGGTIQLNDDAMLLAGVAIDFQDDPAGVLPPFLAPSQSLVLYGQPWQSYRIESRDLSEAGSPWRLYQRVPLTAALELIGPRPPLDQALRVHAFIADPPEVELRSPAPGVTENILFGVPDRTYRLESTVDLGGSISWENGPTTTLTNSFFIFPSAAATNAARFFRARGL